jgi:hypothetical protein
VRAVVGYLVGAVLLAAIGALCLAASALDSQVARAGQLVATFNYDEPDALLADAERSLELASRVPWIGSGPLNEIKARRAAIRYWRGRYSDVLPSQNDPVGSVDPNNVPLQMVVANAVYRAGIARAADRESALAAIDASIIGYLTVLKNSPRNEDAAYNYEYLVQLRDDVDKGRRKIDQLKDEPTNVLGQPGATPAAKSDMQDFKVIVPLDAQEIKKGEDASAGKVGPPKRKG